MNFGAVFADFSLSSEEKKTLKKLQWKKWRNLLSIF